jgi:hypothetical protein
MSLRPAAVWDEARHARLQDRWHAQPHSQCEPSWEYGASWTCATSPLPSTRH